MDARLRRLRYALAVIDAGSVERAAGSLRVDRRELIGAIDHVERAAGVRLVERGGGTPIPTPGGRRFAEAVRSAVSPAAPLTRHRQDAGALRIGFLPHLGLRPLLSLVSAVREVDPELEVVVVHGESCEQVERLRRGDLDVGVVQLPLALEGIVSEPLWPGRPLVALIPAEHPLATRPAIAPADVAGEDLVMFPRELAPATYDWWRAELTRAGFEFRRTRSAPGAHPNDLVASVLHGRGIGLATADFVPATTLGTVAVTRPLDVALAVPDTALAWAAPPAAERAGALAAVRAAAAALREAAAEAPARRPLTARELAVLQLAADGYSAPVIGRRLDISVATVRSHLENAYRKLEVRDRAAAVAVALRQGLIE